MWMLRDRVVPAVGIFILVFFTNFMVYFVKDIINRL